MILPHNLSMLPGVLLAVVAQFSGSWANPNNFLSDKLVVENRVQNVLEHRTAKYTECRQKVAIASPAKLLRMQLTNSPTDDRSNRNDTMRLRNGRKCQPRTLLTPPRARQDTIL